MSGRLKSIKAARSTVLLLFFRYRCWMEVCCNTSSLATAAGDEEMTQHFKEALIGDMASALALTLNQPIFAACKVTMGMNLKKPFSAFTPMSSETTIYSKANQEAPDCRGTSIKTTV